MYPRTVVRAMIIAVVQKVQWNLFITDKLVHEVLSVIRWCPLLRGFIIIVFIYLTLCMVKDCYTFKDIINYIKLY